MDYWKKSAATDTLDCAIRDIERVTDEEFGAAPSALILLNQAVAMIAGACALIAGADVDDD
jgi:hypothetical protein